MVVKMENRYALALLFVAAVGILAAGIAVAHGNSLGWTDSDGLGMMGMMRGMGMMNGMMGTDGFAHSEDDIQWMRKEMKEHMNLTDEEVDEMADHCPMMRGR